MEAHSYRVRVLHVRLSQVSFCSSLRSFALAELEAQAAVLVLAHARRKRYMKQLFKELEKKYPGTSPEIIAAYLSDRSKLSSSVLNVYSEFWVQLSWHYVPSKGLKPNT